MSQSSVLRFSTTDYSKRDRLAVFREVFGRGVANMDITPLDADCWAEAELHMFPGASVMWGGNSAHRFEKSRDLGRSDDDCIIAWATSPGLFRHMGKEITVGAGPAVLMSGAEKATVENTLPIRHVTLKIPRAALLPLIHGAGDAFMRPVSAESDALRLLKSYLATLRADHAKAAAELQRAMVLHIYDLIALTFGATRDAAELAGSRGLPAARLDAMKKYALEHLGDTDFSVGRVARAQGVTPRYVQMLFERDGDTFSAFLLRARLALAHRRLSDPANAGRPIGVIAADCGSAICPISISPSAGPMAKRPRTCGNALTGRPDARIACGGDTTVRARSASASPTPKTRSVLPKHCGIRLPILPAEGGVLAGRNA